MRETERGERQREKILGSMGWGRSLSWDEESLDSGGADSKQADRLGHNPTQTAEISTNA